MALTKSLDQTCVFCKIAAGSIKVAIIAENEHAVVFSDRSPRAKTHYLIVPRKHILNINYLTEEDDVIIAAMMRLAKKMGKVYGAQSDGGFNLLVNNEKSAGQEVFHMHWHFMVK
jgi:histidine triad (HIT) family protein